MSEEARQGIEEGALIWTDKTGLAIEEDSPLAEKLVKGDIIISIEDQKINRSNDLLDILLEYKSQQEISLKYLHDREEQEISIILK